jgi:hypothetical protein
MTNKDHGEDSEMESSRDTYRVGWDDSSPDPRCHVMCVDLRSGAATKMCDEKRLAPWEWFADRGGTPTCVRCAVLQRSDDRFE